MWPCPQYADSLLAGRVPACHHVRRACQRLLDDVAASDAGVGPRPEWFPWAFAVTRSSRRPLDATKAPKPDPSKAREDTEGDGDTEAAGLGHEAAPLVLSPASRIAARRGRICRRLGRLRARRHLDRASPRDLAPRPRQTPPPRRSPRPRRLRSLSRFLGSGATVRKFRKRSKVGKDYKILRYSLSRLPGLGKVCRDLRQTSKSGRDYKALCPVRVNFTRTDGRRVHRLLDGAAHA